MDAEGGDRDVSCVGQMEEEEVGGGEGGTQDGSDIGGCPPALSKDCRCMMLFAPVDYVHTYIHTYVTVQCG